MGGWGEEEGVGCCEGEMLEQDSREEALQAASKESVDQIVEVCNVSREDAFRVLQRCDFDVQLAIERFLMGMFRS